jgi:hypothetical protein
VTTDFFNPPPGEFTDGEFARRHAHLVSEFDRSQTRGGLVGRARRRPLLALAILAALVVVPVSALAVTGTIPLSDWPFYRWHALNPQMQPANPDGVFIVMHGSSDGEPWVLEAFRSRANRLCFGITDTRGGVPLPMGGGGLGCGSATPSISPSFQGDGHFIAYGSTAANIQTVEIRFANGSLLPAATIAPPSALGLPVRFYATQLPSVGCADSAIRRLPARVTAYEGLDGRGVVVATRAVPLPPPGVPLDYRCPTKGTFFSSRPKRQLKLAAALHSVRPVTRVRGPFGATAILSVGHIVTITPASVVRAPRGQFVHVPGVSDQCWRVVFSHGGPESQCRSLYPTGPWVSVLGVQPSGRDVFIITQTRPPVARVRLRFADGDTITAAPVGGIAVVAVPRAHLGGAAQRVTLTGLNRAGAKVGSNTWAYYRERPADLLPEPQ